MKNKIIFVTPKNTAGGAERVMTTLVNNLDKNKYDIIFVTFDDKSNFYNINSDIKIYRLNAGTDSLGKIKKTLLLPYIEYKRYVNLKKVVLKENPNLIVSFLYTSSIISTIIAKKLKMPIMLAERNDPSRYCKFKKMIMKHYYAKANGFVCQSTKMQEYAKEKYGLNNVIVIPNPLTNEQISNDNKPKADKIITAGRLIEQKNHKLLIDAFNNIHNDFKDYKLYIYGNGEKKEFLENYIKKLNLEDYIFLPGVVKDVLKVNNDAKLFVLPSDWEGYPNVLVEAMANGICSISSNFASGCASDIITNNENGFLFNVGDTEELTNILRNLLKDEDRIMKISERGKEIYNKINIDIIIKKWEDYIDKVINGG